jgi:hypothetical protein
VLWFYPEGGITVRIVISTIVGAAIFGGTAGALNWVDWQQVPKGEKAPPPTVQNQLPRRLSSQDKRIIVERLSQFKSTQIAAGAPFGDDEAKAFRDDLVDVLTSAGWAFDGHVGEAEMQPPAYEVGVRINQAEVEAGRIPAAAVALVATLVDLHIMQRDSQGRLPFNIDPSVKPDRFWLFVGIRRQPQQ